MSSFWSNSAAFIIPSTMAAVATRPRERPEADGRFGADLLVCVQGNRIVNHDDEDREFAYTSATETSFAKAEELGWTVISMKNDWSTVF
jgi:hypothetical protein